MAIRSLNIELVVSSINKSLISLLGWPIPLCIGIVVQLTGLALKDCGKLTWLAVATSPSHLQFSKLTMILLLA